MGKKTTKPITAILIGAGTRGLDAYGKYALENPSRLRFIAVAELNEAKRTRFQKEHKIPDEYVFSSWEELLSEKNGKIAQVAFICTPDQIHYKPAIKALELDYDLVLEKPIAPTLEECLEIAQLAKKKGRFVQICHVLRYTEFFKKIKNFVDSGKLGRIIHYDHSENVSYWHFGHSFVRGAYKNKDTSTPIVLAKTCHDLDLVFWIMNEKSTSVYSTGELTHYKIDNAPPNSPERCTDGCPISEECAWYAPRLYLELEPLIRIAQYSSSKILKFITKMILKSQKTKNFLSLFNKVIRQTKNWDQFPVNSITTDFTPEGKMRALKEGPFGLCIYKTGNDVPDHQISTFNFPSGATATLTMHGLSEHEGRELRIFGTNGVIRGVFRDYEELINFTDFRFGKIQILHKVGFQIKGHGGGDKGIMDAFTAVFHSEVSKEFSNLTDVSNAMESHFMGFAAEESRLTNKIQRLDLYRKL